MNGVFGVALALTAAAGCVTFSAPLLMQEVLAWRGGRAASVRVRPHACIAACASSPGGPLVAKDVRLVQPTLWSEHSQRLAELQVQVGDGTRYLLPVPPAHVVRPGDTFRFGDEAGRPLVINCTTGSELRLPRWLIKDSSPISPLAGIAMILVAPFALLFVFAGFLGRQVVATVEDYSAATGSAAGVEVDELAARSDDYVNSGMVWLSVVAAVACGILLLTCSARWPRPHAIRPDGLLELC